jgi:sortase B
VDLEIENNRNIQTEQVAQILQIPQLITETTETADDPEESSATEEALPTSAESEPESEELRLLEVHPRFEELLQMNENVVGEIIIDGTTIDYPVVFSRENEFYLSHDIFGDENRYGAIFMDRANRGAVLDGNTILHGNNLGGNDRNMFADLEFYKNREFFDNNRIINFNNLYSDMEWEVFAVYVVHVDDYYMFSRFNTHESYLDFIEHIKSRALFFIDFEPDIDDRLLTLHTNSYEFTNAHTLVTARLINKADNMADAAGE